MYLKKSKICVVAPSLQLGGLENSVSLVVNYLAACGHEVSLILCYKTDRFYQIADSVRIYEPSFERKGKSRVSFYLKWLIYVREKIKEVTPAVVLSYGDFHNSLVLIALYGSNVPVVISDRASPSLHVPYALRLLRSISYQWAAGIIAQTTLAAEVKGKYAGKNVPIRVIPNVVRKFSSNESTQRQRLILAAARHYDVKGLDRLVQAVALAQVPGWTVEIAGSKGPVTSALERQIESLGVEGRVRLLGAVEDMGSFYARGEIFVLPSRSEGFPNALIEAMSCGCAVISFDIDAGPSDIIHHGENGILVKDGDIDGLARAITTLAHDDDLRWTMAANASLISDRLSLDKIGSQVEEFLISMVR